MKVEVTTPFDFCANCNNYKLEEIQVYAGGEYSYKYSCKYRNICKNAVNLYKQEVQNDK